MDGFTADVLVKNLDNIERVDRLATIAESRRKDSLREIERHRLGFGETLRRSVQKTEDAEFVVIESAKGKNAA